MTDYQICCEKCCEEIAHRNMNSARLWLDFCSIYKIQQRPLIMKTRDNPQIRTLETMGYLVSTEIPGYLVVNMKSRQTDLFCCREAHNVSQ